MTYDECKKAVRDAQSVWGYINFTNGDGTYVKLMKRSVVEQLGRFRGADVLITAEWRGYDLYIAG